MIKLTASLLVVCSMVVGCESGHQIAGVASATAVRQADGRVAVTAKLSCMLVSGMGRADNTCDADGTTVCVNATWFAPNNTAPVATARGCAYLSPIQGFPFVVTSRDPIPQTEGLTVVVAADGQDQVLVASGGDGDGDGGAGTSTTSSNSVTIPSP